MMTSCAAAAGPGLTMRPHHLLCLVCRQGGGCPPQLATAALDSVLQRIVADIAAGLQGSWLSKGKVSVGA